MKQRLLITGFSGFLGANIAFFMKEKFDIAGAYYSHPVHVPGVCSFLADMKDPASIGRVVREFSPDVLFHGAAEANVDRCEAEHERARCLNVQGTENVIRSLKGLRTKLVYVSTDQVYGPGSGPHTEAEILAPVNVYGRSKLEGEGLALSRSDTVVMRTNFFGWDVFGQRSLAEWLLRELGTGRDVTGFRDALFSSLYTADLAGILERIISKDICGVYNVGASTALSKYAFLVLLAGKAGLPVERVHAGTLSQAGLRAPRNSDLSMDVSKLAAALDFRIPTAEEGIAGFVADHRRNVGGDLKRFFGVGA